MTPRRAVVAIPPSYNQDQSLELYSTANYLKHLEDNGVSCVMTTAGTSQFNFLSSSEIHQFNECVCNNFSGEKIIGIPPVSSFQAADFADHASQFYLDSNSRLMALYPDRFYDQETLIAYVESICDVTGSGIYLHAQKMRSGISGEWNYTADILNRMCLNGDLVGIKEEHSSLQQSYDFVNHLNYNLDVIVAGGSMRRFQFLEPAGANAFLSGIGNLFPNIENRFFDADDKERKEILNKESRFFDVFMKIGWHRSLREALKIMNLTCLNDRNPWPECSMSTNKELTQIIEGIKTDGR